MTTLPRVLEWEGAVKVRSHATHAFCLSPLQFKRLNTASFPVQYSQSFYQDVVKCNNEHFNRCAYRQDTLVGAISARIDPNHPRRLYIMTLAVLAAYRGRGIGSQLLQSLLDYCESHPDIDDVILHVQTSNTDAIRFYTERFGFTQGERIENYYKRIDPPHCYVVYKKLKVARQDGNDEDVSESASETAAATVTDEESCSESR